MSPKLVKAEDAVGLKLAYDVSMVTKEFKGALFRRGHIIRADDVERLKKSGHYYVLVEDNEDKDLIHEEEAVVALARVIAGSGTYVVNAEEGKALIMSSMRKGYVKVNVLGLNRLNELGDYVVITKRSYTLVSEGDVVGIVDLVPLYISRERFERILEIARLNAPVIEVKPPVRTRVGLVVTGNEVFEGLVRDEVTDVVVTKLKQYGAELVKRVVVPDDFEKIRNALIDVLKVSDIAIATGGMSVDPTDYTHKAIASIATNVVMYGIPIKPNTMSMLAYRGHKVILGVPGSIVYFREWNVIDVLLPKLLVGEKWTRKELLELAHGGISDYFLSKKKLRRKD